MSQEALRSALRRIDGRPYPAYKDIRGVYEFDDFDLEILHVQGDPFASPSRIEVRVPVEWTPVKDCDWSSAPRRVGVEDALARSLAEAVAAVGRRSGAKNGERRNDRRGGGPRGRGRGGHRGRGGAQGGQGRGSGKSGRWGMVALGQEILPRTAVELRGDEICARLTVGLPAQGRRILGLQATDMFFDELIEIVGRGILRTSLKRLNAHAAAHEDQCFLRDALVDRGWVAFIADGAVLARQSGVDDRPMAHDAVPWRSPEALSAEIVLPNHGAVRGTAIPTGVTLICGGGYHGKSTVLQAIARAVYSHVPGDGRELCATDPDAVQVRAEDGRSIRHVDISPFIGELPDGRATTAFSSVNASGSTSQAASIMEALELEAACLLIDEDTSATNFMVRDRRMQELIATEREPITPFVDRVQELARDHDVSTVLVVGGSGDYFEVADHVIVMDAYEPRLATEQARAIAAQHPSGRLEEARRPLTMPTPRVPTPEGLDSRQGHKREKVRARETRTIQFGHEEIEVALLAQLIDDGQTRAIGDWLLACQRRLADGQRSLLDICEALEDAVEADGLSSTTARDAGDRVMPRRFEFAAALNRLRTLSVRPPRD